MSFTTHGSIAVRIPPLRNDSTGYEMVQDYTTLTNQNLKSLILTVPGEHTMNMEYGVGLRKYLFEMVHAKKTSTN